MGLCLADSLLVCRGPFVYPWPKQVTRAESKSHPDFILQQDVGPEPPPGEWRIRWDRHSRPLLELVAPRIQQRLPTRHALIHPKRFGLQMLVTGSTFPRSAVHAFRGSGAQTLSGPWRECGRFPQGLLRTLCTLTHVKYTYTYICICLSVWFRVLLFYVFSRHAVGRSQSSVPVRSRTRWEFVVVALSHVCCPVAITKS